MDIRQKFWTEQFTERASFKDLEKQPDSMVLKVCTLYADNCLKIFDEKFKSETQ